MVCLFDGVEIPCETEDGVWYAARGCYIAAVPPGLWPPAGDPIYGGADPETAEGGVYWCTRPGWIGLPEMFWLDGPAPVDPRVIVEEAAKALPLEHARALTAPGPDFHTYIHVDNWMWVPEGQWHTTEVTVTAGPISVTAVGEPVRVEWDMGTETVTCYNAGSPWIKGMTDAAKTTCSYAYETLVDPKGDVHVVSARIVYAVTWTCAGPCLMQAGELGEYAAPAGETTTIEVRQRQTVVTN